MKKITKALKDKIEHGDIKKIAEYSGITQNTIGDSIRAGKGSRKTLQAIEDYYIHIENVRNEKLQEKTIQNA